MNREDKAFLARQEFRVRYGVRRLQVFLRQKGFPKLADQAEEIYRMWDAFFNKVREVMRNVD